MRKFLFGVMLTITVMLVYRQCTYNPTIMVKESSTVIKEQLKNVSKLVVTEGHFSEVFNYENSKKIFGDYLTAEKKALVIVNAKVSIAYDLKKLAYKLDEESKIIQLLVIPNHEITINPDLEYYDIQDDFLNTFDAADYNDIKKSVNASLLKNIKNSTLVSNAQNRLISELSKFFILTNSLGWKLEYKGKALETEDDFKKILL